MSLAMFETGMLPAHPAHSAIGPTSLDDLNLIAGAVFVVAEQDTGEAAAETLHTQDAAIAAWFSTCAERLTEGRPLPPAPDLQAIGAALDTLPPELPIEVRSAIEARLMLLPKIERAGTYAVP